MTTDLVKKAVTILSISAFLWLCIFMIQFLVQDRQERRGKLIKEMSQIWGKPHLLKGVYLGNKANSLVPVNASVRATVKPDIRYKGIYALPFYSADVELLIDFEKSDTVFQYIDLRVNDSSAVEVKTVRMNNRSTSLKFNRVDSGLLRAPLPEGVKQPETLQVNLNIKGIDSFELLPLAPVTKVKIDSSWQDPSFIGTFLPLQRQVNDEGFKAEWLVKSHKINYAISGSAFGVNLFMPVDIYSQTDRSLKYGLLFILLTFLFYFIYEVLGKFRTHPWQYLLIGLAMCIFYLLLLSLSEHISFSWAYIVATMAVVALVTQYTKWISKTTTKSALAAGVLVTLYTFLFVLLYLEKYSLLMGSVGLFVILALVMYLTRNIDWYKLGSATEKPALQGK